MANAPKVQMSADGTSGLVRYGGYLFDEWNPELQGPRGRRVLREMRDQDPTIGGVIFGLEMLIRQVSRNIVAGDSPDDADDVSDDTTTDTADPRVPFIASCIDDMNVTFPDQLAEILDFLPYGWGLHELMYKRRDGIDSRYTDGKIGWAGWPVRGQETLLRWDFADDGTILGMIQLGPPDWLEHYIPLDKAMLFRTTVKRGSPEGRSILRNCYSSYYMLKHIMAIEAIGAERDLAGLPVMWVPPEILADDASDEDKAQRAVFEQIVRNIRRDEQEGILMPLAYDPDSNEKMFDLTLITSGGQRQFDTGAMIARYKNDILTSMLADFLTLGHQQTGSNAMASTRTKLWTTAITAWLEVIAAQINTVAIPRLLALNGMDTANPPRLVFGQIEKSDLNALGQFIVSMRNSGIQLDWRMNGDLATHLLDEAGLPGPPADAEALMAELKAAQDAELAAQTVVNTDQPADGTTGNGDNRTTPDPATPDPKKDGRQQKPGRQPSNKPQK